MDKLKSKGSKKISNIFSKKQKWLYCFLGIVLAIIFYAAFFYNYTGRAIIWKIAFFIMYGNSKTQDWDVYGNNRAQDFNWSLVDRTNEFLFVFIPLLIFSILIFSSRKNKKYKLVFWGFFSVPIIWLLFYFVIRIMHIVQCGNMGGCII